MDNHVRSIYLKITRWNPGHVSTLVSFLFFLQNNPKKRRNKSRHMPRPLPRSAPAPLPPVAAPQLRGVAPQNLVEGRSYVAVHYNQDGTPSSKSVVTFESRRENGNTIEIMMEGPTVASFAPQPPPTNIIYNPNTHVFFEVGDANIPDIHDTSESYLYTYQRGGSRRSSRRSKRRSKRRSSRRQSH